jgi:glucose/arabinose dehydrogenase
MRLLAFHLLTSFVFVLSVVAPVSAQLTTQTIVGDVDGLVAFVQDPVLANTFYLAQRTGKVLVLQNGTILETPLLDLTGQVRLEGEEGLLGLAFSPNVDTRWLFVNFTNTSGDAVIARFTREAGSPVAGSRLDLQWPSGDRFIDQPANNHKGGHLAFGPDGFLYIGLGDGGGGNDTFDNGQDANSLLGKMLRIDVNVDPADQKGYRVPASNPFVGLPTFGEIWAFGYRNPWRYSFDNPALGGTGALVVGDVGQSAREEVDYEPAGRGGRNYGWPIREGLIATPGVAPRPPLFTPLANPIFDYPREIGQAVTGGYVYRGAGLPASFRGRYFVADYVSGLVGSVGLAIDPQSGEAAVADAIDHTAELGGFGIVSFTEDLTGELYLVRSNGPVAVAKIVTNPAGLPSAPQGLTSQVNGSSVALSWSPPASGVPSQYQLEVGSAPGASNLLVTTVPGGTTSLGASGVADGVYFVRLRAVSGLVAGLPSNEIDVRVGCSSAPAAPSLSQAVNGGAVSLSWGAVENASGYVIEIGTSSGGTDISVPVSASTTAVSGAPPSGTYFVRLRAQNACGLGVPSNQVTVVVQ